MTLVNVDFLRKIERLEPELKDVLYPMVEVLEKPHEEITRLEFSDLKDIVKDLATAQERTEKRVEELAAAQERTEKRVEELAAAQERTERRVEELTGKLEELTRVVMYLAEDQKKIREELGGLATTVGYTLENEAYKKLPALLEKDYGLKIKQRLTRKYVRSIKGNDLEINIFGTGEREGKEVTIIGESKAQLSNNKVDEFFRKKINPLEGVFGEVFLVLVTHMISSPGVEEYVKNKGIALYYSYDF